MNPNTIVVLNDLRGVPVLSALKLRRSIPRSRLVAHISLFCNREYADYTNNTWKLVLKFFLVTFFNLKVVRSYATDLEETELTGVLSSLVSITEDSMATAADYPAEYEQLFKLGLGSKDLIDYISKRQLQSVFLFNGRGASCLLLTKFCVRQGLKVVYYEYAAHGNGFRLFPVSPHASRQLGLLLYDYYRHGLFNFADLRVAALDFRHNKLHSKFSSDNKLAPSEMHDIVIFLGSDYEYAWLDTEITGTIWNGNVSFCQSVFRKYGKGKRYAIRCHPNSIRDPSWVKLKKDLQIVAASQGENVRVYGPDEKIDSHELVRESELIVTAYSTISMDAIMMGKSVDIMGDSDIKYLYEDVWMNAKEIGIGEAIVEAFSLGHNFLVFRFSLIEKIVCRFLYYIQRSFDKTHFWKVSKGWKI